MHIHFGIPRTGSGRRRTRAISLISAAALAVLAVAVLPATATASTTTGLTNPGFENGSTAGWSGAGSVTSYYNGKTAPDGTYFATVRGGCLTNSLTQAFHAHEGQTLTGWAFFQAHDYYPYVDSGSVNLSVSGGGGVTTVFSSSIGEVGSYGSTPWKKWTYTVPADGLYTISARSSNAGDCRNPSVVGIDLAADSVAPTVTASATSDGSPYTSGTWTTKDVTVEFACTDDAGGSGVASVTPPQTVSTEGAGQSVNGTCTDNGGNTGSASFNGIQIDKTAPTASFDVAAGTISDAASYTWGTTPAAPTCTAIDTVSGPDGCDVTGFSTAVGTHTLTATATDKAGNLGTSEISYTVAPWETLGFFKPIDMDGVVNTVKNGSTVPVKFQVYAGGAQVTDPTQMAFSSSRISCDTGAVEGAVEVTATGSTALRYDTTAGHFVYNWATPKTAGACYKLTMTSADGTPTSALFKLK